MNRKSLDGCFGMYEMEEAVELILSRRKEKGLPLNHFYQAVISPLSDFSGTALVGLCHLIAGGWLLPGYPNSEFCPSKGMIKRLKERGVLPADALEGYAGSSGRFHDLVYTVRPVKEDTSE